MLLRFFCVFVIISCQLPAQASIRGLTAENSQVLERFRNFNSPPPSTLASQLNQQSFNGNEELGRIKRAANSNFSTFRERMTLAARIFAGISLRIGLHNQSIPADEALAELLNLDHFVKLEHLEKFEKAKADEFVTKLNAIDFASSTNLTDAEEVVLLLDGWRSAYERIDDPKNATSLKAYVAKVEAMNNDNLNFGYFQKTGDRSSTVSGAIHSFRTNSTNRHQLASLKEELEDMSHVHNNISDFLTKLRAHDNLIGEDVQSSPLLQFVTLLNRMIGNPGKWQTKAVNDQLLDNVKKVSNLKASSSGAISLVEAVVAVVQGRQTDKIHTSGLINGFTDLNSLPSETGNAWLKTAVPNFDSRFFESALRPLISLHDKSALLKNTWTAAFTNRNIEVVNILKSVMSSKTAKIDWMSNTQTKQTGIINSPGFRDRLSNMISNIATLRKNLFTATPLVEDLLKMDETKNLEELCRLSEKITLSAGSDTIKQDHFQRVLTEMRKFTRTVELKTALEKLKPKFEEIANLFKNLSDLAKSIVDDKTAIDVFIGSPKTRGAINFFKTLKETTDVTEMADGVRAIQSIGKMKKDSNYIRDAGELFNVFQNSAEKIKSLRGVPVFIRAGDNEEMDVMMQLQGIHQPSKTFGIAVTGLNNIQKVLNEEATIQSGLADGLRVEEEAEKISKIETKQAVLDGWSDFRRSRMAFQALSVQLNGLTNMASPSGETLLEYSKLFEDFKGVMNLNFPSEEMLEALEVYKRERAATPALGDVSTVENALKKISVLDMHFAKFDTALGEAHQSVNQAVLLLKAVSYSPGAANDTISPPEWGIFAPSGHLAFLSKVQKFVGDDKNLFIVILGVVFLVICAVGGLIGLRFYLNSKLTEAKMLKKYALHGKLSKKDYKEKDDANKEAEDSVEDFKKSLQAMKITLNPPEEAKAEDKKGDEKSKKAGAADKKVKENPEKAKTDQKKSKEKLKETKKEEDKKVTEISVTAESYREPSIATAEEPSATSTVGTAPKTAAPAASRPSRASPAPAAPAASRPSRAFSAEPAPRASAATRTSSVPPASRARPKPCWQLGESFNPFQGALKKKLDNVIQAMHNKEDIAAKHEQMSTGKLIDAAVGDGGKEEKDKLKREHQLTYRDAKSYLDRRARPRWEEEYRQKVMINNNVDDIAYLLRKNGYKDLCEKYHGKFQHHSMVTFRAHVAVAIAQNHYEKKHPPLDPRFKTKKGSTDALCYEHSVASKQYNYNANCFPADYGETLAILGVAPTMDNVEAFLHVLWEHNVIHLTSFDDDKADFTYYKKGTYETVTYGDFTVQIKFEEQLDNFKDFAYKYVIDITYRGISRRVEHIDIRCWKSPKSDDQEDDKKEYKEDYVPENPEFKNLILHLLKIQMRHVGNPLLGYDNNGGYKIGTFIAGEFIAQHFHKYGINEKTELKDALIEMYYYRGNILRGGSHATFAMLIAFQLMFDACDHGVNPLMSREWEIFQTYKNPEMNEERMNIGYGKTKKEREDSKKWINFLKLRKKRKQEDEGMLTAELQVDGCSSEANCEIP